MRIAIPEFNMSVFSSGYNVMGIFDKFYICDRQLMGKNRLDTISKVQIPQLNVFIDTGTHKKSIIWTDIKRGNWQFVTIKF